MDKGALPFVSYCTCTGRRLPHKLAEAVGIHGRPVGGFAPLFNLGGQQMVGTGNSSGCQCHARMQ